jgi:triacylglycerol esterase/lipase EstA (alpha/beta hydrolase family)
MASSHALHGRFPAAFSAPSLTLLAAEPIRALFDHFSSHIAAPPALVGDGHPVIVYPGWGAGAFNTSNLRNFLRQSGFSVHDWEGGVNTGPDGVFDDWLGHLDERVRALHRLHERKVSLLGWSLGGVYAREIAKRCPDSVRQVITLGTPFAALAHGNHGGTVFKLLNSDREHLPPQLEARLREAPPVPTTSVYSKSDGVVCWRGCVQRSTARAESVEVDASHLGMVSHPQVLRIIADRLAQPDGKWRPLKRTHMR